MDIFFRNKKIIHYLITLIVMFGFGYLPAPAPITPYGMKIAGVFLGAVYGWTVLNMLWPSLLGLIALGFHVGMTSVLQNSFGSPIIVMLLIIYVLLGLLEECGATKVLAKAFISNRLTSGRPWIFVYLMFVGTYACAQIHPFVAILLFIGFTQQVCRIFKIDLPSKFSMLMALGIAIASMLGQITFPFLNTGLVFNASYQAMAGAALSASTYVTFMIPLHLVLMLIYTVIMKVVCRLDLRPLKNITAETFGEKVPLTEEQKIALIGTAVFLLMALGAAFLPQSWLITNVLNRLTIFGLVGLVVLVLMLVFPKSGQALVNYSLLAGKHLSWDTIFISALILALSGYLGSSETGIAQALSQIMQPLLSVSPLIFIIVTLLIATVVTNFMNNIVVVVTMMPMMINILSQIPQFSTEGIILLLFIVAQFAVATPAASAFVGICFATENLVEPQKMMTYSLIIVPLLFIFTLLLGIPYSFLVF